MFKDLFETNEVNEAKIKYNPNDDWKRIEISKDILKFLESLRKNHQKQVEKAKKLQEMFSTWDKYNRDSSVLKRFIDGTLTQDELEKGIVHYKVESKKKATRI